MTRDEWYKLHHDRRLVRRQWRLLQEALQRWANKVIPPLRCAFRALEPVMLDYERRRLIETLAKVRDGDA